MIKEKVEDMMKTALNKFAQQENVTPNNIAFFIHTKPTQEDPELTPKYFYTKNNDVVLDEQGKTKELDFKKDILGKRIDFLGISEMTSNFLKNYIKSECKTNNIHPTKIYLRISSTDEQLSKVNVIMFNGTEQVKTLTLEEVFNEE